MSIIDETYEISQGLHRIRANELGSASGTSLDRVGREYSLGREPAESDTDFRHRLWMRIMKVMTDAAAAEIKRRRGKGDEWKSALISLWFSEGCRRAICEQAATR